MLLEPSPTHKQGLWYKNTVNNKALIFTQLIMTHYSKDKQSDVKVCDECSHGKEFVTTIYKMG